jgi:pimeloyl-ACP methyl ester carboxylesterase
MVVCDHRFALPLDHNKPAGDKISVFAREVVANEHEHNGDLPWLVFFQGGPGFPSPRPEGRTGWLKRALKDYRVLLLDQRGTGLSTPVTYQTLAKLNSRQQADYLKNFRADAIVRDAEIIRGELAGGKPWSGLGQSYGGFCLTHYLSAFSHGLKEVIITGGLPPVSVAVDDIYRATYKRVEDCNRKFFERYPEDEELACRIARRLSSEPVSMPGGGQLTVRRFQQLGIQLGFTGGAELLHYLLEGAFVSGGSGEELSYVFLRGVENALSFETNPIYVLLHEPIYCEGSASRWSAQRVALEYPQFTPGGDSFRFTGEMIYPWMLDDYQYLRPLKQAAELLAEWEAWPSLYDRENLRKHTAQVAAAVYYNDMYVETSFSEATARLIPGIHLWITNEYEHNAIRADGERVLDRLLSMLKGDL